MNICTCFWSCDIYERLGLFTWHGLVYPLKKLTQCDSPKQKCQMIHHQNHSNVLLKKLATQQVTVSLLNNAFLDPWPKEVQNNYLRCC